MAVTKIKPVKSTLSKALDYIENPDKTDGKMLISSFGCSYETADIEFGYTLSQAREKGNNLAFHMIQSFAPGEVDYQKAHEIGRQLADAVTKGQHEYVLTTHIDKGHIHNHIIFCAVNFVDHLKNVSNKRTYYGFPMPRLRFLRPLTRLGLEKMRNLSPNMVLYWTFLLPSSVCLAFTCFNQCFLYWILAVERNAQNLHLLFGMISLEQTHSCIK